MLLSSREGAIILINGRVGEWVMPAVLKTASRKIRGFKSYLFHQIYTIVAQLAEALRLGCKSYWRESSLW